MSFYSVQRGVELKLYIYKFAFGSNGGDGDRYGASDGSIVDSNEGWGGGSNKGNGVDNEAMVV